MSPLSSIVTSSSPGSPTPAASVAGGTVLSAEDQAALADPTLERVAEYEARVEAAIAERSGLLAILGPDAVAWLAEERSRAFKVVLDAHKVKVARGGPMRLSSERVATLGDHFAIPGSVVFGATFSVSAMVGLRISLGYGQPAFPGQPETGQTSGQQTVGGRRISTTSTTTSTLAWSGSTIISDLTLNQTVTIADAATGALLGTTTNQVHVHAEANGCPDAAGIALVKLDVEFTGDASGMAGGSVTEMRSHSETKGQVDDAAVLASVSDQVDMTYSTTSAGTRRTSTATTGLALPANVTQVIDDGDVPPAEAANARAQILMLTGMAAAGILTLAQSSWRDGACVRIDATTARVRQVAPNKVVTFTAKPVHIIEGTDLDKPIVATFSGDGTLAPVDTSERPPVSYTYTAPSKKDKTGTALLKSTSNRGIGILNIAFRTVVKGWVVDYAANGSTIKGRHCGPENGDWIANGTYDRQGSKGKQKWIIDMALDGTGTYSYTDNAVQNVGPLTILLKGKAKGNVTLMFDDDGRALMHLKETEHTYRATVPGTPGYGNDRNAPLVEFDQAWEVDETCP